MEACSHSGLVKAICISDKQGIEKRAIEEGHFLVDFGIEEMPTAGHWHRQVSLLSYDKVKAFNERGANVIDGAFGENLVVEGMDFQFLPSGHQSCTRGPWSW
ncbi:MAG: MOSC domain-containing protein [Enterocloster sp.]